MLPESGQLVTDRSFLLNLRPRPDARHSILRFVSRFRPAATTTHRYEGESKI